MQKMIFLFCATSFLRIISEAMIRPSSHSKQGQPNPFYFYFNNMIEEPWTLQVPEILGEQQIASQKTKQKVWAPILGT